MLPLLLLILVPMLFGLYAQSRVRAAYGKNSRVPSRGRITGAEAARAVMESAGINDVAIVEIPGTLTDHYDPVHKRLALSRDCFHGTSLAALGVAAHESGHALQDKTGYPMLAFRLALAPATQVAAGMANLLIILGGVLIGTVFGSKLLVIGAGALALIVLFQLVTLPVEFDASRRAKRQLVRLGILQPDEMPGVNETLDAAALTYVAGFVSALGSLLHLLLIIAGASRRD
ncbi:MAG: zinc metallopeptidase [Opitutaceae bacterium]|jgi:Zn-dependent membrane protease YugP|nr:zinc metallopeptidase [Opitutaceae bacterium]